MNEEYEKGREIGELIGELKSFRESIETHNNKQDEWNAKMDERVSLAEQWIQTTTGKVVVLTTVFGIVGSVVYLAINWLVSQFK